MALSNIMVHPKICDGGPHESDYGMVFRIAGPAMVSDEIAQRRIDIQPTVIYVGTAARGEPTSAMAWRIKRIDLDGDGNPTVIQWSEMMAVWDDRATTTYS